MIFKAAFASAALLASTSALAQSPPPPAIELWHPVVYFDPGSADLPARGLPQLRRVVAYLAANPARDLIIEAHTDTAGEASGNLRLSSRRAQAVVDELLALGAAVDTVTMRAHGETRPAVATGDGVVEPLNRRVTIDWRYP